MASSHKLRSRCCFNEWMHVQEQELNELLHAQTLTTKTENSENLCIRLTKKIIKNYEEYMEKRSQLFHDEASGFFAPRWWRTHLTGWEAVDPHRLSGFFTHKVVQKLLLIVNQLLTSNMQNQ